MATIKSVKGNPDPHVTFAEKKTDDYGLKIANAISRDWFNGGLIDGKSAFMTRRDRIRNNRLFVRGEQNLANRKNTLASAEGELEMVNISWEVPNFQEKFCRVVSNSISDENYTLDIRSSDKLSLKLKEDKKETLRKQMVAMPLLKNVKNDLGVDLLPKGFTPENEEELDFLFETEERPKAEIFEEVLIDYVKHSNDWDYIQGQTVKDLVDNGMLAARVWTDPNNGVMVDYVDIENYVHSNVRRNDFKDKNYEGVVETITISDLRRESDFSDEDLRKIGEVYGGRNNGYTKVNWNNCAIEEIVDVKIDVLRFAWKTSKTTVLKKKIREGKTISVSRRDEGFNTHEDAKDVGVIERKLDTWFEGNFVIGSNAIYGYKECENLARDVMNKAMSPFVVMASDIYENVPRSFLDNIKPMSEDLLDIIYRIRLLRSKLRPDLVAVDINQLAELGDGKGGSKKGNWQMALNLMNVQGVVFTKRNDLGELGIKDGAAAYPMSQQQGSSIGVLLNEFAFHYNNIRDVTGVNPVADGSSRPDALVGVSQMAQLAFNNATKHIVNTAVQWNKKLCEVISTRINGVFRFEDAKHIQEMYMGVVGKNYKDAIEVLKNRHLHEFAFTFRFLPFGEELKDFNQALMDASNKGLLKPVVAIAARNYARTNVKLAIKFLMYHTDKEEKRLEEQQMMLAQNKSQNDSAAAQAKVQADTQAYQAKAAIDIEKQKALSQIKLQEAMALKQMEEPYLEKKFQQDVMIERAKSGVKQDIENFKEDRKDQRTQKQASQQSKLIDQRQKDKDPIDFEDEGILDFNEILQG